MMFFQALNSMEWSLVALSGSLVVEYGNRQVVNLKQNHVVFDHMYCYIL